MKEVWKQLNDKVMYYGFEDERFRKIWEITGIWWELEAHSKTVFGEKL